jgi:tetratricopeptide (TPR) repeat protein
MVESVIRVLANLAGPMGTLLVLDDLQWAGPDALHLLTTLVRSAGEMPLRIVGAYRDTEVQTKDALAVALADLAHMGLVARRRVGPLAPEEAAQVLDGVLAGAAQEVKPAVREQVLRQTGGVPFFLVSCAQGVLRHEEEGPAEAVPWDVAQSVRQRVATLPDVGQAILGVAAVVGRAVPRALLATLVGQSDDDLLKVLDTLCHARLLEEQAGDAYQFAHDIIRDVVEADLGAARRSVVHRRVAEALERQAAPPLDLLAYHYGCSDRHDKAEFYLKLAGDRATAHYAHSTALAYYREVVARLDRVGRRQEAAGVHEKMGAVLKTIGQYDQALLLLEQAVTIHRAAGDLEAEAHVVAVIGEVHFLAGTWEAGIGRVQQMIAALEARGPSSALAALYSTCIPLFAPMGRYRDYLATAERASELARSLQDARVLAKSETWRGVALVEMDRAGDARPILERAVALADGVGDLVSLSRALSFLGTTYLAEGAFVQALTCRERACATCELEGNLAGVAWTTSRLADVHALLGNWAQARALYERAIGIYRGLSGSRHAAVPLVGLGLLSLHEGAGAEAGRYLEEGLALAERTSHLGAFRQAQLGLAEKELREGAAQAALTRLQHLSHLRQLEASVLTVPLPVLAWAHLELGHLTEAEALIVGGVERARGQRDNRSLIEWLWLQGMARLCRGCWQEAQCTLDEALMLARGMPYPFAEARLLHTWGLFHLRRGEHGTARDQLQSALTIFRRLGARNHVEEAEHVLATLPHP